MAESQFQEAINEACSYINISKPGWRNRLQGVLTAMLEPYNPSNPPSIGILTVIFRLSEVLTRQTIDNDKQFQIRETLALVVYKYCNRYKSWYYRLMFRYLGIICGLLLICAKSLL